MGLDCIDKSVCSFTGFSCFVLSDGSMDFLLVAPRLRSMNEEAMSRVSPKPLPYTSELRNVSKIYQVPILIFLMLVLFYRPSPLSCLAV